MPTIERMIELCEEEIRPRKRILRQIVAMEREFKRRQAAQQAAAEKAAREADQAEQQRRDYERHLVDIHQRAVERYGDDAPALRDIERADRVTPVLYSGAQITTLTGALSDG